MESDEPLREAVFMGRRCKEERVQGESLKVKNKQRPTLKIPQADKTSPVIQTKLNSAYFEGPTLPGSFLVYASGDQKQTFPKLIGGNPWPTPWHLRKCQYCQLSIKQAFTGNQSLGPFFSPGGTFMRFSILYPLVPFYTEILLPYPPPSSSVSNIYWPPCSALTHL